MAAEPLLFYRQILTLNEQILAAMAADPESLEAALTLLQERHLWMRDENRPAAAAEAPVREQLLPLMETILGQDEAIAQALAGRQEQLAAELRNIHQLRVSRGYHAPEASPEARFLDQAG